MQPFSPPAAPLSLRDQQLWRIARGRTKFQGHLLVFLVINAGLWLLYALVPESHGVRHELPWPLWTSLFWGLGLALQGAAAYSGFNGAQRTQREFERLRTREIMG